MCCTGHYTALHGASTFLRDGVASCTGLWGIHGSLIGASGLDKDLDRNRHNDLDRNLDSGLDSGLDRNLDKKLDRNLDRNLDVDVDFVGRVR